MTDTMTLVLSRGVRKYDGGVLCNFLEFRDEMGIRKAYIYWSVTTGEVMYVWTSPHHRRQGLASRLWEIARTEGARHSAHRTVDGQKWAQHVAALDGDVLPKWRLA